MQPWANTGMNPEVHWKQLWCVPYVCRQNLGHIKGVITREAVGHGNQEWREYLTKMEDAHDTQRQLNIDEDGDPRSGCARCVGLACKYPSVLLLQCF